MIDAYSAAFGAGLALVVTVLVLGRKQLWQLLYNHSLRKMQRDSMRADQAERGKVRAIRPKD